MQTLESLAQEYEAARVAAKAAEETAKKLAKALLEQGKADNAFVVGEDGKSRLLLQAGTYTLTTRVTESLIDAFKAYRVLKVIPLRLLASVITFDKAKVALAVQEGRMTEEQLSALRDGAPSVSEYLTPGRPAKR
jgi:hypothetical protein